MFVNTTFRLWYDRQALVDSSLGVCDLKQTFIVHVFFQVTYSSTNALCIMYDIIEHFYPSTGDGSWQEFNIMPSYSESTHSMIGWGGGGGGERTRNG